MRLHRRTLLQLAPATFAPTLLAQPLPQGYPSHPPQLAREMVGASHGNIQRVKDLVKAQPDLAKASWDWGFGDWETALGAASHVGNRAIAELLIDNGAPPTLFSATMLGHLDTVKAFIESSPGVQKIPGPHSISLLAHAKAGGERAIPVHEFLEKLGDAGGLEPKPLTEEAISSIVGPYTFEGLGPSNQIDINAVKAHVELKWAGGDARRLFHLGELTFFPVGAQAVRIRFDGKGMLRVHDAAAVITAKRKP